MYSHVSGEVTEKCLLSVLTDDEGLSSSADHHHHSTNSQVVPDVEPVRCVLYFSILLTIILVFYTYAALHVDGLAKSFAQLKMWFLKHYYVELFMFVVCKPTNQVSSTSKAWLCKSRSN